MDKKESEKQKQEKREMKRAGTSGFVILKTIHAVREYCVLRKT